MMTENQQKKSSSYAIEMMLKLSLVFDQMSSICKTAVIQFTKDLHLGDDYERFAKYRVLDQPKRQLTVPTVIAKTQEKLMDSFENLASRRDRKQKTNSSEVKKSDQSKILSPNKSQKKQQVQVSVKPQPSSKKPRFKDPILQQKHQHVQGKRNNRQQVKIKPIHIQQQTISQTSEPSDYKARSRRKGASSRAQQRRKSKVKVDPSQRRPLNGFMCFFQEVKDKIKQQYNVSRVSDVSHFASVEWKKLSPQVQEKYKNMYYQNLEKFKKEAQLNGNEVQNGKHSLQNGKHTPQNGKDSPLGQQQNGNKPNRNYVKVKRSLAEDKETKNIESDDESSSSSNTSSSDDKSNTDQDNSESSNLKSSTELKKKFKKIQSAQESQKLMSYKSSKEFIKININKQTE